MAPCTDPNHISCSDPNAVIDDFPNYLLRSHLRQVRDVALILSYSGLDQFRSFVLIRGSAVALKSLISPVDLTPASNLNAFNEDTVVRSLLHPMPQSRRFEMDLAPWADRKLVIVVRGNDGSALTEASQMSNENKRLLRLRKQINAKRPKFRRYESWRYNRVKDNWRRPMGIDSHMRERDKGQIPLVGVGYRGPKKVRGLHPSGKHMVHISTIKQLEAVDPETQVVYIAAAVGLRKRWFLQDRAEELGVKLLNGLVKEHTEAPVAGDEFIEEEEEVEEEDLTDSEDEEQDDEGDTEEPEDQ